MKKTKLVISEQTRDLVESLLRDNVDRTDAEMAGITPATTAEVKQIREEFEAVQAKNNAPRKETSQQKQARQRVERVAKCKEYIEAKLPAPQIALKLGVSLDMVKKYAKELGMYDQLVGLPNKKRMTRKPAKVKAVKASKPAAIKVVKITKTEVLMGLFRDNVPRTIKVLAHRAECSEQLVYQVADKYFAETGLKPNIVYTGPTKKDRGLPTPLPRKLKKQIKAELTKPELPGVAAEGPKKESHKIQVTPGMAEGNIIIPIPPNSGIHFMQITVEVEFK